MVIHPGPIALASYPRDAEGFVGYATNVGTKFTGNVLLPNPTNPTLPVYLAAVAVLAAATTKARDRAPQNVADRIAAALTVARYLGHLVDYTQGVADMQVSAADAIAVILGAGFQVRKNTSHKKPALAVKYSGISGAVFIVALAIAGGGAYYWEFSLDQHVWSAVPETRLYKTTITGLTPGQMYYFRFRTLTKQGKSDYSPVVSIMMH